MSQTGQEERMGNVGIPEAISKRTPLNFNHKTVEYKIPPCNLGNDTFPKINDDPVLITIIIILW
jgi:hypothetical protein